jgi:heterodisulfide reductase subunit B
MALAFGFKSDKLGLKFHRSRVKELLEKYHLI